jgi:hypothetical protein
VPRDLPVDAALRAVRGGVALQGLGQLELLRPELPAELHGILRRALQTRREHRYASAAEMQLDLEKFLKGWPRLSSSLLLGEYVRRFQVRPPAADYAEEHAGHVTPVMMRTPEAPRPFSNGAAERLPGTVVNAPDLLPSTIVSDPLLRRYAEELADSGGADTLVDPSLLRPSAEPAGAAESSEHTARVAVPTVLVSRAGLPTRRGTQAAKATQIQSPPVAPTLFTPMLPGGARPRRRRRLPVGVLLPVGAGIAVVLLLIVMLLRAGLG